MSVMTIWLIDTPVRPTNGLFLLVFFVSLFYFHFDEYYCYSLYFTVTPTKARVRAPITAVLMAPSSRSVEQRKWVSISNVTASDWTDRQTKKDCKKKCKVRQKNRGDLRECEENWKGLCLRTIVAVGQSIVSKISNYRHIEASGRRN